MHGGTLAPLACSEKYPRPATGGPSKSPILTALDGDSAVGERATALDESLVHRCKDAPLNPNALLSSPEFVLRFIKDGRLKLPNMPGRDLVAVGDESVRDPELGPPVRTESDGRPDVCPVVGFDGVTWIVGV